MENERKVLALALCRAENDGYSNIILNTVLNGNRSLSLSQKSFITTCFYGVLERRITIDAVLNSILKRKIEKMPIYTASVLRLGAYQILFLNNVPIPAAVDECVKLVKGSKYSSSAGMVNAVLRKTANINLNEFLQTSEPYIKFSAEPWIYYTLAKAYSKSVAEDFFKNALLPPPIFIKINTLIPGAYEAVLKEFNEIGASIGKADSGDVFYIERAGSVEQLKSYKSGLFFVQDHSAALVTKALDLKENSDLLDCCAAPGGKSFSAAIEMKNTGRIVSADLHEHRAGLIKKGALRLKINNITAVCRDATVFSDDIGRFDRVLCDVPCSGIGVIRRKPEIKYKKYDECSGLPDIQLKILSTAAGYLKPGGRLVYSTCTLLKQENERVAEQFLKNNPQFTAVQLFKSGTETFKTFIPPASIGDGFFIAAFKKSED